MATNTRTLNPDVVKTGLDKIFWDSYNKKKISGHIDHSDSRVFNQESINNRAETVSTIYKGIGEFVGTAEEGTYAETNFEQGPKRPIGFSKFTNSVKITEELEDDDMWGVVKRHVADMGRKAMQTKNRIRFDLYRGAFTVTETILSEVGSEKYLVADDNETLNGDVVDNKSVLAFSETGVDDLFTKLYTQVLHDGTIDEGQVASTLLVPTSLHKEACVLLDTDKVPGSNNNDINYYSNKYDISLATSRYIGSQVGAGTDPVFGTITAGSDTAYFLLGDEHRVMSYTRKALETNFREKKYSDNGTSKYLASFRDGQEAVDFIGVTGSTGAGA
jgi:hypothetical protein